MVLHASVSSAPCARTGKPAGDSRRSPGAALRVTHRGERSVFRGGGGRDLWIPWSHWRGQEHDHYDALYCASSHLGRYVGQRLRRGPRTGAGMSVARDHFSGIQSGRSDCRRGEPPLSLHDLSRAGSGPEEFGKCLRWWISPIAPPTGCALFRAGCDGAGKSPADCCIGRRFSFSTNLRLGSVNVPGHISYLAFDFPGTIAMAIIFSSPPSAISVILDREFGFLKEGLVALSPRRYRARLSDPLLVPRPGPAAARRIPVPIRGGGRVPAHRDA